MDEVIGGRVAVVEDHTLVRQALVQALEGAAGVDVTVVFQGATIAGVLALIPPPDLVLLDLDLGDHQAGAVDVITLMSRGSRILVVSALASPDTVAAMAQAGVAGFVSKRETTEELVEAVTAVLAGGTWTSPELAGVLAQDTTDRRPRLSPQEQRVLVLYASGLTLDAVAHHLQVKPGTVREYLERIRAKYDDSGRDAHTKTSLYREAVRDGYLHPGS